MLDAAQLVAAGHQLLGLLAAGHENHARAGVIQDVDEAFLRLAEIDRDIGGAESPGWRDPRCATRGSWAQKDRRDRPVFTPSSKSARDRPATRRNISSAEMASQPSARTKELRARLVEILDGFQKAPRQGQVTHGWVQFAL